MKYLLDSCCFIEPSRTFCAIDVGLSFWNKISELSRSGQVFSIDKVKAELIAHKDDLSAWVDANLDKHFFLGQTEESFAKLREIQDWVIKNTDYTEKAKSKYLKLDKADIYLTSFAAVSPDEWTVVSQESPKPGVSREIKLPDICGQFGVKCIKLVDMFREMGETF